MVASADGGPESEPDPPCYGARRMARRIGRVPFEHVERSPDPRADRRANAEMESPSR
jgi:hypothetical protein